MDERCAECAWISDLRHNFQKGKGFEESFCCIAFVINFREAYVVEVHPDDMCEMFQRRPDIVMNKEDETNGR